MFVSNPSQSPHRSSRSWAKTKKKITEKQPHKVAQPQIIALLLLIHAKVLAVWPPPPTRGTLQTHSQARSVITSILSVCCGAICWPKNSIICFLSTEPSIFRGSICGSSSPQLLLPCLEEDNRGANKARLWLTWFGKQKQIWLSPPVLYRALQMQ